MVGKGRYLIGEYVMAVKGRYVVREYVHASQRMCWYENGCILCNNFFPNLNKSIMFIIQRQYSSFFVENCLLFAARKELQHFL